MQTVLQLLSRNRYSVLAVSWCPPKSVAGTAALCDKYDILLIAMKSLGVFGRTGSWFGARAGGFGPRHDVFSQSIPSVFPFGLDA
ncbi:MAG: hypothetical protein CM1200mP18_14810 [Gammaproteobacteria bacterium]|nr:MAG: hypothetical protein CM1200mP18_14810 [Gammaproteobacteria bacterium]